MNGEQTVLRNQTHQGTSRRKSRASGGSEDGSGADKKTQQAEVTEMAKNNSKQRPVRAGEATPTVGGDEALKIKTNPAPDLLNGATPEPD
jgi:hypothetical protein